MPGINKINAEGEEEMIRNKRNQWKTRILCGWLGWHKVIKFDKSASFFQLTGTCERCKKSLLMDSWGGWF
jgi:hypothetical protein